MSDQHDNFERDLTEKLTHLAESAIPDGSSTTDRSVDIVRWREQPRRRIFDVAAAAAAVIVVVVGFVVVIGQRDDPGAVRTDYPPAPDTLNTSPPAATTNPTVDPDAEEAARKRAEEQVAQAHEDLEDRVAEERDRVRAANEQLIAERFAEIGVDYVPLAERRLAYLDPEQYPAPHPIRQPIIEWVRDPSQGEYTAVRSDGSTITWSVSGPVAPEERGLDPLDVGAVSGADDLPDQIRFYQTAGDGFSRVWVEREPVRLQSLMITVPEDLERHLQWIVDIADRPIESIAAPSGYLALGRPTVSHLSYSEPDAMVELAQFDKPIPDGVLPISAVYTDLIVGDGFVESRERGWRRRAWRVDETSLASITIWNANEEPELMDELWEITQVGLAANAGVSVREEGFPGASADGLSNGSDELVKLIVGEAFDGEHVRFVFAVSSNQGNGSTCSGFMTVFGGISSCGNSYGRVSDSLCSAELINNGGEHAPDRVLVLVDSERADEVAFEGDEVTTRLDSGTSGDHEWTMIEATIVGSESATSGVSVEVTVDGEPCGASPESTSEPPPGTAPSSPVGPTGPATTVAMTDSPF